MQSFKDTEDREWNVEMHVSALNRVRKEIYINLSDVVNTDLLEQLANDRRFLCKVVYAMVGPQREDVSEEQFSFAMGGDQLDAAFDALLAELVTFLPRSRRDVLKDTIAKMNELQELTVTKTLELLNSGVLEEQVTAAMDKAGDELREKLASA